MEHDLDPDRAARLAALQARRSPAAAHTTPATPGRSRRNHPARGSRIAATVMSAAAMVGITAYMASSEQTATADPAATVTAAADTAATTTASTATSSSSGTAATLTAATTASTTEATTAATTATTQATTTTQGS